MFGSVLFLVVGFIFGSFHFCEAGGPQRGIGLAYWNCDDAEALDAGWFYNWTPNHPCKGETSIPFIPMIWGTKYVSTCPYLKGSGYDALLTFNEPNAENQANMAVSQAIDAWPDIMQTGLRIGAPCVTQWGAFDWLQDFMQEIWSRADDGYWVDFLCFHYYADSGDYSDSYQLYDYIKKIKSYYSGYPIWITEFANSTGDGNVNKQFMNNAYDYFTKDFSDTVERYAWFTNRQQSEVQGWDLIDWDNGKPTDLGYNYKSKPNNS